ncbi:hypothetical protein B5807_00770 [Epicoccum nigrum]|uniref:Uncharacterized protein n=1 Tax=Epicoccum nigrum TaxID=105696 RepID=A0A1Y2MFT6_EPING|nr:hypothetical protein B5807_00770 [Epicoccum nigrum]
MPSLQESLPWISTPLILNAPMAGSAGGALAAAVTLAGGLGMIGSTSNMAVTRRELAIAREALDKSPPVISTSTTKDTAAAPTLPIGIGFLAFLTDLASAAQVVAEHRPAVVWLFAAKQIGDYSAWAEAMRSASPSSRICVQTGSVGDAVEIASSARPDALCVQGADAGGHGLVRGAGIISLLPEAADALAAAGHASISLLAAGGIADGRAVAAALALGAHGVVMGTRFLASTEATPHPVVQASVLEASDGGQVTVRSTLFDQLGGPNIWPQGYDGRSLAVKSYREFGEGESLGSIQERYRSAVGEGDKGFKTGLQGRAAIWAGTGVGLVKEMRGAGEIVEGVRAEARGRLAAAVRV